MKTTAIISVILTVTGIILLAAVNNTYTICHLWVAGLANNYVQACEVPNALHVIGLGCIVLALIMLLIALVAKVARAGS